MHNNIMVAGSRDRPPMLATGRYAQWRSRFLRYIDIRPNGDALRKCILEVETLQTMSPENKAHYESEKEAIHLILTGIGVEIYLTVDACKTAQEIWEAIERLQQASEEDSDPKQPQRNKDMQKNLALVAKYFKKIYKPTNNLRTSSNSKNKNVDTTPRYIVFLFYNDTFVAEQCVPLQAEHVDWLADTDDKIDKQELEAHYSFMAEIQEVVSP
nr:hypothetical protein [Tanacetum cinerariifolium]